MKVIVFFRIGLKLGYPIEKRQNTRPNKKPKSANIQCVLYDDQVIKVDMDNIVWTGNMEKLLSYSDVYTILSHPLCQKEALWHLYNLEEFITDHDFEQLCKLVRPPNKPFNKT